MNSQAETATGVANLFTVAYDLLTNKIRIVITNATYTFRIITQPELKTLAWNGPSFNRNKPNDVNEILNNLDNYSKRYNSVIPYYSGSVNLQPFKCIYIHISGFKRL